MVKRNRKTLEELYMGPEPLWDKTNPCPSFDDPKRTSEWSKASHWYSYKFQSKDHIQIVLKYCKEELKYKPEKIQALKKLAPWKLGIHAGSWCRLFYRGWIYTDEHKERMRLRIGKYLEEAKVLKAKADETPKKKVIPPAERMRSKMMDTIYADFDDMVVEKWMEGDFDKIRFPVYNLCTLHGIKGAAVNMFREKIQFEYDLIHDAYHKNCDQAVEAYSHIKKGDKKKMLNQMDNIFKDLDALKQAAKATRKPRLKKAKLSDEQVTKLNFKADDVDSKLVSINPVLIPSKNKLFVYNVKQRRLIEYVSDSTKGFEIRGSTIYNWNEELSRATTLRKPQDILPSILTKTEKQLEKLWDSLTTKIKKPTGRINTDCILVRVI